MAVTSGIEPFLPLPHHYRVFHRNSPPAHQLPTAFLYRGFAPVISNISLGFNAFLYDSGKRSRSTSKERDAETGLDYFGARYFSGAQGRFTSVDPGSASASLFNPQTWNGYSYGLNNPLKFVDPDGQVPINIITAGVGAVIGGTVGAAREYVDQVNKYGEVTNGARIWTAAGGGALAGGIAGFTLGIGAGAGVAAGALETGIVTASSSVIGDFAQHRVNDSLGLAYPGEDDTELQGTLLNAATAGSAGGAVADRLLPIPNVQKEIQLLRFASRRSTRAARIQAASVRGQAVALGNSSIGNTGGAGIQQTFLSIWNFLTQQMPPEVTTRICFPDEKGKQSCQ